MYTSIANDQATLPFRVVLSADPRDCKQHKQNKHPKKKSSCSFNLRALDPDGRKSQDTQISSLFTVRLGIGSQTHEGVAHSFTPD
jgi:hypothetical protein